MTAVPPKAAEFARQRNMSRWANRVVSIRRCLASAHEHELFLTKPENEPCGLIETVCDLSGVRIHHLSSFRLRRPSQRRDYLLTRHTQMQLAVEYDRRELFRDDGAIGRGLGVFSGELFNDLRDEMVRAAYLSAGQP